MFIYVYIYIYMPKLMYQWGVRRDVQKAHTLLSQYGFGRGFHVKMCQYIEGAKIGME